MVHHGDGSEVFKDRNVAHEAAMAFRRLAALTFALVTCLVTGARASPTMVHFAGADGQALQGYVYAPTAPGKHPAIVALHGCSGLLDGAGALSERHVDWGERWLKAGYVVVFPDSYGSRGLPPQCKVTDRDVKPAKERVADANAALTYLSQRPDVDAKAITLIGWSNGGSSTLYAVEPKNRPDALDFIRAIAFYPGCRVPLETGRWSSRLPLTILIGASDDWTPAGPCVDLGTDAKGGAEPVDVVTYPGAYHDFDHPNLPVHLVEGLAFTAEGGGAAHTGTDPAARADAIKRVMDLLKRKPS